MGVYILISLLIYFTQTLVAPAMTYLTGDIRRLEEALGPRDKPPPTSKAAARYQRALENMSEALPVFLALSLLVIGLNIESKTAEIGAMLFAIARAIYVPVYAIGIAGLRSIIWMAGHTGLLLMVVAIWPTVVG